MKEKLVIGTRRSKLAVWQAEFVASLLRQYGLEATIKPMQTTGDSILDISIAKIGSKGVFTEAIEKKLLAGSIDIAVHSAKDLPSDLGPHFEIIAFTHRALPNDVVVSCHEKLNIHAPNPISIGTSSTRRTALLKRYFPHVQPVDIRGNLHTRIRKMKEGHCDALLLAFSGVQRMSFTEMIVHVLPPHQFIPAVGQGSIAIEIARHVSASKKSRIRRCLNHHETEISITAERAFLKRLQGGCSIPAFALATLKSDQLSMQGGVISMDGKQLIQERLTGHKDEPTEMGTRLADLILQRGGKAIIAEIKNIIGSLSLRSPCLSALGPILYPCNSYL